ncbi:hypothetical protein [Thalassobellus suaedae]|uniref:Orn/Lys/Arg decarboxylases family 1 pyridoxal-P attachment site domain-containing protein n=1 Tax=Thalassobellus suaedae TaxID=3074124 RepID=A0ABY9XS12_9FLAO|nr:hypothetical protein RHP51_16820 [Flavobacteriaceae bacterium HL-DH14]
MKLGLLLQDLHIIISSVLVCILTNKLYEKYNSPNYRKQYNEHIKELRAGDQSLLPDPDKVRIRVYATQSTHKTLSSFRQGSMIHIWDEDFRRITENTFLESYMTHTSTSPNYQMLASLDVGRRQVQLEGFELVEKSIEMAMVLRAKVNDNPQLSKYFDVLTVHDFIPDKFRQTGTLRNTIPNLKVGIGWTRLGKKMILFWIQPKSPYILVKQALMAILLRINI